MKNIIMVLFALFILTGCSQKAEQDFEGFASDFYIQMFSDGEQTKLVTDMHGELENDYKKYADEELYVALSGMYEELATGEIESQLKVMALMNE